MTAKIPSQKFVVACAAVFISVSSYAAMKIMPLGDSITEGDSYEGAYRENLYYMLDSAGIDFDYVGSLSYGPDSLPDPDHEGHSGWTVAEIYWEVDGWVSTYQPDIVLLMIGTNDMWYYDSTLIITYDSLLSEIYMAKSDAHIFAASIPPIEWWGEDSSVEQFNADVEELVLARKAAGDNITFVDVYNCLTTDDLCDGVHLAQSGNAKAAAAWFDAIMENMATETENVRVNSHVYIRRMYPHRHTAYDLLGRRLINAQYRIGAIRICDKAKQPVRF